MLHSASRSLKHALSIVRVAVLAISDVSHDPHTASCLTETCLQVYEFYEVNGHGWLELVESIPKVRKLPLWDGVEVQVSHLSGMTNTASLGCCDRCNQACLLLTISAEVHCSAGVVL